MAGFVQQAACTALTLPVDPWRQTVAEQSEHSWQRLNEIGLTCPQPEGSFYCFPSIVSTGLTSEQFALKLAEQAGVAVLPGTLFGQRGAGHVRLSVCTDRQTLDWALEDVYKRQVSEWLVELMPDKREKVIFERDLMNKTYSFAKEFQAEMCIRDRIRFVLMTGTCPSAKRCAG